MLLPRPDGTPWGRAHQQRRLAAACERASTAPAISFHALRHTHTSRLAMRGASGVDLRADGGAIILPMPRTGWRWSRWRPGRCDLAPAPGWLVRLVEDRQRPRPSTAAAAGRTRGASPRAVEEALAVIASARPGSRQATLAREAWRIRRLVRERNMPEGAPLAELLRAAAMIEGGQDWDRRAAEQTARRCFAKGAGNV